MKKALITMGLVPILLVLALFVSPSKAYAQDCETTSVGTVCASLVGNDVVVTLLGVEIARITAPVKEVRVEVPVPGPTDIIRVPVPGPTKIIEVPGPTRTVAVPVPGATSEATATVTLRPGQQGASRVTIKPSATPSAGENAPVPTATATKTVTSPPKVVVDEHEKKVRITIPQAIGLSVGLLLLGLVLGLLGLYTAYAVGYKNSEQAEAKKWREFSDNLFGKKGKH